MSDNIEKCEAKVDATMGVPNLPNAAAELAKFNPIAILADPKHPDLELVDLIKLCRRYLAIILEKEIKSALL